MSAARRSQAHRSTVVLFATLALPAVAAAQGFDVMLRGSAGASCTARALGAQPFVESKSAPPDFDPLGPMNVSGQTSVPCSRQGDPGVMASSDASSHYSGTIAGAGSDVFGNTLASSITIEIGGNANASATGDVVDGGVGSSALSSAGVLAGFSVLPGTMITVVVTPAGTFDSVTVRGGRALPSNLSGGFSGAATESSGSIEVEFIGSAGARTTPRPSPAPSRRPSRSARSRRKAPAVSRPACAATKSCRPTVPAPSSATRCCARPAAAAPAGRRRPRRPHRRRRRSSRGPTRAAARTRPSPTGIPRRSPEA